MDDWFDENPLDEHDPPTLPHCGPMGVWLDADYVAGWAMGALDLDISSHDVLRCPDIAPEKGKGS